MSEPIVILGAGLAGYTVAREVRKRDTQCPLVIISADEGSFYSKPMISNALAQKRAIETLPINTAGEMAETLNATILTQTRVTAISPAAQEVLIGERRIRYSGLVLALGADQLRIELEGDAAPDVMSVNDLESYARFRASLERGKHVVILGAGLIGCEFANDLRLAAYEVSVVDIAPQPLNRLLPPQAGAYLRDCFADAGVGWHLGTRPVAVSRTNGALSVTLNESEIEGVTAVLSAVGLRPRVELARTAGLEVKRGIIVDRRLQTSDPSIYALGDCAEVDGLVLPYVMPIMQSARALAAALVGQSSKLVYPAMPVIVKTPACPTVVSPPIGSDTGAWHVDVGADGFRALHRGDGGMLTGFALGGSAVRERNDLARQLPAWLA